jgi:DNA-binding MurR/RpiR family transcriptional regulator
LSEAVTANVERFPLENPFNVAFETTRAYAARSQTPSATVVRAAQRLGCEGFIELRNAVRRSLQK